MHLGAGGNDGGRAEEMAQRALQIALPFEQRCKPHVGFEIARFAPDQVAVDGERFERIFLSDAPGLLEPLADARRSEALFDLAGGTFRPEIEQKLSGLGLDEHPIVAHHYSPVVVDQLQSGDRTLGVDQLSHATKTSLERFEMAASAQEILRKAHHQKIVESETILAALRSGWIDELPLDPIANSIRRDRENSRGRSRRECTAPSYRLAHLYSQRIEYRNRSAAPQRHSANFLTTVDGVKAAADLRTRSVADLTQSLEQLDHRFHRVLRVVEPLHRLIVRHAGSGDAQPDRLVVLQRQALRALRGRVRDDFIVQRLALDYRAQNHDSVHILAPQKTLDGKRHIEDAGNVNFGGKLRSIGFEVAFGPLEHPRGDVIIEVGNDDRNSHFAAVSRVIASRTSTPAARRYRLSSGIGYSP